MSIEIASGNNKEGKVISYTGPLTLKAMQTALSKVLVNKMEWSCFIIQGEFIDKNTLTHRFKSGWFR